MDDHNYASKYIIHPVEDFVQLEFECLTTDEGWQMGKNNVDHDTLAKGLKSCYACASPLHLHTTVSSKNYGLASVLHIVCENCSQINSIHTDRKPGKIYDMNTTIAIGK